MFLSPAIGGRGSDGASTNNSHQFTVQKPLTAPPDKPQERLYFLPLSKSVPQNVSFTNSYDWGNCTAGVASWVHVPDDLGNANMWAINAKSEGYEVSDVPQVGSVGQTSAGYWGHVVLVEQVNGDQVYIKEMNAQGLGVVDERWATASDFVYIYF